MNEKLFINNALHVTKPEWMLLPIHKGGTFGNTTTSAALFAYDFLAGVNKNERREMLTAKETLEIEPLIKRRRPAWWRAITLNTGLMMHDLRLKR